MKSKIKLIAALIIGAFLIIYCSQASAADFQIKQYDVKIEHRGKLEGNELTEYTYTIRQVQPNVNNPQSVKTTGNGNHDVKLAIFVLLQDGVSPQFHIRITGKRKKQGVAQRLQFWKGSKPIKPINFNTVNGVDTQKSGNFTISFREVKQ